LIDRRWHLSILDVQFFRRADCSTDHYLVVTNVRVRSPASKQTAHKFHVELDIRKKYQIKISNGYAALENLNDS